MTKNFFTFDNIQTHSLNQTDKNLAMLSLEVSACIKTVVYLSAWYILRIIQSSCLYNSHLSFSINCSKPSTVLSCTVLLLMMCVRNKFRLISLQNNTIYIIHLLTWLPCCSYIFSILSLYIYKGADKGKFLSQSRASLVADHFL